MAYVKTHVVARRNTRDGRSAEERLLREKGETVRWQPVSPTLIGRLVEHGQARHNRVGLLSHPCG